MEKNNIIVLAKKREGRSKKASYSYLSINTNNILIDKVENNKTFYCSENLEFNQYDNVSMGEYNSFYNITTALISFYWEELVEVETDINTLKALYHYLLERYEDGYCRDKNCKETLKENEKEVTRIYRLIEKWYNEDNKR